VIDSKPTWRRLSAANLKLARAELEALRTDHARGEGNMAGPLRRVTVATLCGLYRAAGCPDAHRQARTGKALAQELSRLSMIEPWWGSKRPSEITQKTCDDYADYRMSQIREKHHENKPN
jgi:hypothetical protein